jgi:hypothetical protein
MSDETRSTAMPDFFDRQLGALHGLPDVTRTKASTVRTVPPLGIGGTQVFIVSTYRQREIGDTIFLEVVSNQGAVRIAIPPAVSNVIARQRDALTTKVRSKAGKERAAEAMAQGIVPGFMRNKVVKLGKKK